MPKGTHLWLEDMLSTAAIYYRSQRPLFEAAAREFQLHWSWAQTKVSRADATYDEMAQSRFEALALNMDQYGRDDARIEKDKCEMYRFFMRNELPMPRIIGEWSSNETLIQQALSGEAFEAAAKWPVFLKACHLTQGAMQSVLRVKSSQWVLDHPEEFADWVNSKWDLRADDSKRAWGDTANKVTDGLEPGFMLQSPAQLFFLPELGVSRVFEIKVVVLWGRAYLAQLVLDNQPQDLVFLRSGQDGFDDHNPVGATGLLYLHWLLPNSWARPWRTSSWRWLVDENHLACVWRLGERAARIMGIEEVRLDIFVSQGDPDGCMLNENSISSGSVLWAHKRYLAKLWAAGHVDKQYKVWGDSKAKPVYMMLESDLEPGQHS